MYNRYGDTSNTRQDAVKHVHRPPVKQLQTTHDNAPMSQAWTQVYMTVYNIKDQVKHVQVHENQKSTAQGSTKQQQADAS